MVQKASEGTFVFRFSGNAGAYALTVKHDGLPRNWRISTEKDGKLELNGAHYTTLLEIVNKHSHTPLKIFQLLNSGKEDVILTDGIPRELSMSNGDYANLPKSQRH